MKEIEETIEELNKNKPRGIEDASLRSLSLGREAKQLNASEQYSESSTEVTFSINNLSQTRQMQSFSYKEEGSDFVGFKDMEKELENRVMRENCKVIGVFGPIGSGKTTLVKRIYNRKSISEKFVCHVWLDVAEEQGFEDILLRVWNQVNENENKELTVLDVEQLKEKLSRFLQGKTYLIVLDDARKQQDNWSKLIHVLPEGNASKVVLITSQEEIAESLDKDCLLLRPFDDYESWELFSKISCQEKEGKPFPSQNEQILKKCQGLPLNIVLLGGFVSSKGINCEECTQDILGNRNTEIWLLSYTDLPAHYKLCLLYLTLFPKKYNLSVRRIIRLWLAEGFLKCPPELGLGEDLAEKCFNDLVKRNLVKVSKLRSDGGPRKCYLPGFLYESLLPIAQDISFFRIHQNSVSEIEEKSILPKLGVRRLVEYAQVAGSQYSDPNFDFQNLRSYLSFNFQRYDTPAKGVANFLRNIIGTKGFGLLRVLDLESVYKPMLPQTLKQLFQLRYLGLRWTFLDTLPQCVGDLPYLETLDLKRTHINTLPSSVWKLKHLRHLYLPEVRFYSMQNPSSQLLTLWGLIIDDECDIKNGLNKLCDLRELGVTCQLSKFDELMMWIRGLSHLQSLNLTSKDEMGRPSEICLETLSDSELLKLSHLKLLGKLSHPLKKNQFPPHLRVITLSVSHLEEDPMFILSQLEYLSVLRLLAKSYCGKELNFPQNGFSKLRVLKLWMLDELEEWILHKGAMPIIRELNIRRCKKLKKIPIEIMQRETLKKLNISSMPEEFEANVRKEISNQTLLKIDKYDFSDLPWETEPDLWK